jgi:hypothetical protein
MRSKAGEAIASQTQVTEASESQGKAEADAKAQDPTAEEAEAAIRAATIQAPV